MGKILDVDFKEKEVMECINVEEFINEFSEQIREVLKGKRLDKVIMSFICDTGAISMSSINVSPNDMIKMSAELQAKAVYMATLNAVGKEM